MTERDELNRDLEAAALALHEEYALPRLDGKDSVIIDDLQLAYGMHRLVVDYQTPLEHAQAFARTTPALGNPDIDISTYNAKGNLARYKYDRFTGLTLVNNFSYDPDEVRPLTRQEYDALSLTLSTQRIAGFGGARALTGFGILRLTDDLQTAYKTVQAKV